MNVTRLRNLTKRHGNFGVAIAGVCIVWHVVWSQQKKSLNAAVIILCCLAMTTVHIPRELANNSRKTVAQMHVDVHQTSSEKDAPEETKLKVELPVPNRSLIPYIDPAVPLNNHFRDYAWLSPTRLMLVWSDRPDRSYKLPEEEKWTGRAESLDTRTHTRRQLYGLSKLFQRGYGIPGEFRLSPGRIWLEWTYACTGDAWPFPAGARIDGSGFQEWDEDKFSETGWLDDHRWVEVGMRQDEAGEDCIPVSVTDLSLHSTVVMKANTQDRREIMSRLRARNGGDIYDGLGLSEPLEIRLGGATTIACQHESLDSNAGGGVKILDVTVRQAHSAKLILYEVQLVVKTAKSARHSRCIDALYVGSVGGSKAREIGYLPSQPYDYASDPEESHRLTYVRWLPDDRRISFVYMSKLYVVKAD